jgi:phosphatidylglycerol---prolipoprotein diacylglyceryl transferase
MLPIFYQGQDLILYSYPLLMGLGWGVGYQIFFSLWPKTIPQWQGQVLFWGSFIFAWIGAKILFLLSYPNEMAQNFLTEISFWTGGGFVFYGGLLGGIFFLFIYHFILRLRLTQESFWPIVPSLTLGHGIGRVGCLLAGCCFGKETEWWWGIHLHGAERHPTQIIESIFLIGLGIYLLRAKKSILELAAIYLISYGVMRFGIEFLRGDKVRGEWGILSPSQWISIFLLSAGLVLTRWIPGGYRLSSKLIK